jgi:integrase
MEILKNNKPLISEITLNGYYNIIRKIYYTIYPEDKSKDKSNKDKNLDINKLLNIPVEIMIDTIPLVDKSLTYKKNILCAVIALKPECDLKTQIKNTNTLITTKAESQEPSQKNIDNHVTKEQIQDKYNELFERTKTYWDEIPKLDNMDMFKLKYMELQDYVIFCLISSIFIPCRRSRDWYDFKIRNINTDTDNYIDKKEFVFNAYKTSKTYGEYRMEIPKELYRILRKWIRLNPNDYLFTNSKFYNLDASGFAKRSNKIWGRPGLSVNSMRHAKLQNDYPEMAHISELKQDLKDMSTSLNAVPHYVKKL